MLLRLLTRHTSFLVIELVLAAAGVLLAVVAGRRSRAAGVLVATAFAAVAAVIGWAQHAALLRAAAFVARAPGLSSVDRARLVTWDTEDATTTLVTALLLCVLPLVAAVATSPSEARAARNRR